MTVTVVVCTRKRPRLLEECLAGLQTLSPPPDQLLVVDNTPGDPETEMVARRFNARYLIEPTPGLKHAMKRALSERDTDMVAFLRDDVVPANNWLALMLPGIPEDVPEDRPDKNITSAGPLVH